jgi:hypothetical protein
MVVLDELADDRGAICNRLGRKIAFVADAADYFVITQQDALQNAVLAHQVLVGRDSLFFLFLFREKRQRRGCRSQSEGQNASFHETTAEIKRFGHGIPFEDVSGSDANDAVAVPSLVSAT